MEEEERKNRRNEQRQLAENTEHASPSSITLKYLFRSENTQFGMSIDATLPGSNHRSDSGRRKPEAHKSSCSEEETSRFEVIDANCKFEGQEHSNKAILKAKEGGKEAEMSSRETRGKLEFRWPKKLLQ